MNKDRSLLFGKIAVSMKKVSPEKMSEMARKTESDPEFDLGASLVASGVLTPDDKAQIDSMLEMSLAEHEGDASKTLQAFGKNPNKLDTMLDSMDEYVAAFESNAATPPPKGDTEADIADSILGGMEAPDTFDQDGGPLELDSLVDDDDPAKTRLTQSGNTNDKASVGDIVGDAPDSFFESIANTDTQIMSPVQAAAEIDESEIVPAVSEHEGRYETIREFAKGGMGQITLVHDTHLGRDIALKQLLQRNILPETRPGAPTTAILTIPIIARFLQEARITGQLEHPSIIPVYELGYRADGSLYYTMKLIRGQSMHDVLKDCKDIRDRMKMLPHFLDMCQAISYAHSRGVIHRDLKPMNIMIGEFGETVVIDWGIAKVKGQQDIHEKGLRETVQAMRVSSAEATAKTMYGQTIGSPYFMPAEQAMGRTDLIDERSDIYSLGAVLYVILTGQMPYAGNNVREFMGKVGQVDPKPVKALEPTAPPELAAIVKKAMAQVPENRYQSARELTDEIEAFISGGMVSAYDYSLTEMIKRYYKKHKTRINMAAGFLVVLLIVGVYSYISIRAQKVIAETQRDRAVAAQEAEEIARKEEARQREIAEMEKERAQQELYYANIANAKFNINEQQMAKARELLANCEPEELREWEWGHLAAETHADMLTVDRAGRFSSFAGDGSGLVTGTFRGSVALQDLDTGEVLHEFIQRAGFSYAVAGSADMTRIAVVEDNGVHVWDIASKEELFQAPMPEQKLTKNFLAFSGNGKYVAALASDRVLRVWDVDSGAEVVALDDCQAQGFNVFISHDGTRLLVARQVFGENGWERQFSVVSVPEGEILGTQVFPEDSVLTVQSAAFSPDNQYVAIGTDVNIQLWDVGAFEKVDDVPDAADTDIPDQRYGHPDQLAFSPDGAYLAAGSRDGNLILYSTEAQEVTGYVGKAHEDFIRSVRFTHGGTRVGSVADDRTVRLWARPDLRRLRTFRGHDASIYTLGFSQDDTRMASSSPASEGTTKVWDISADLEFAPTELDKFVRVTYDKASGLVAGATDDLVIVWEARTGHRVHELPAPGEASMALAFNPAGTKIVSVSWHENAEVLYAWDLESGEQLFSFPTGLTGTDALHFINDDSEILIKGTEMLNRFDTSGQAMGSVFASAESVTNEKRLYRYDISPQADRITASFVGAGDVASVIHMSLAGEPELASLDFENVSSVTPFITPFDGKVLVCQAHRSEALVTGGSVAYWNLTDNSLGESETMHTNEILTASFGTAASGPILATGGRDSLAVVWDAETLTSIALLRGHAGSVSHLDFHPDGRRLVTGSADRTFKIWDTSDGTQLLTLNDAAVEADLQVAQPEQVAFSQDGLQLATLTSPAISPMILHAFSTDMAQYPEIPVESIEGDLDAQADGQDVPAIAPPEDANIERFEARMEAYKRQYWRQQ